MAAAKYIVGIDLGTTNMVVSYAPLKWDEQSEKQRPIKLLDIVQEQAKGSLEKFDMFPSFIFKRTKEKPVLPWSDNSEYILGTYARERGAEVPDSVISSAKSWLCNPRIDRTKPILPWNEESEEGKISPLDAETMYLTHIRLAWAQEFPKDKLENQKVIITIPASFDAAARDLVLQAAKKAGLSDITLLEEPQAAFYSWIAQEDNPWRQQVKKGDIVLVADVGGGTTDFSLIEITESNGDLALERVAVGNHILLGGDNMDLTLAYIAAKRLQETGKKITRWQTIQLSHQCRKAKEELLSDPSKDSVAVTVSGRSSSVIGGTIKTKITREDLETSIIEGFFPDCSIDDDPLESTEGGVRELNLMYAADAGITRHLAKFLRSQNIGEKKYGWPNAVLFNGGVFNSQIFRDRLVAVIDSWLTAEGKEQIRVLDGSELSRAVARGATYFGEAKEGKGIRIRGGVSRSYYLGIESSLPAIPGFPPPMKALCVAKQGTEEGTVSEVPNKTFGLKVGKKANFKLFKSNCRREDNFAEIFEDVDDTIEDAGTLVAELPAEEEIAAGDIVDVALQIAITEIGTLEIYCVSKDGKHKWKLEFNVRDAA